MIKLQTLHQLLRFPTLAPVLGLGVAQDPVVSASCPYCHVRAWYTTYDNGAGALWHYCAACGKSGHILDLLAFRHGLSREEVFPFLRKQLGLRIDNELEAAYDDYRKAIRTNAVVFRESQQNMLAPTAPQRDLLQKFGLLASVSISSERWFDGPCQLCGVSTLASLRSHGLPVPTRGSAVCLVVPFCLVPGYAHRLHVITDTMTWDLDAAALTDPTVHDNTPVFAGMQLLHQRDDRWLVGTTMIDLLLRLHIRNFSIDGVPLPLFGWSARERSMQVPDVSLLHHRPVVLWERVLSPAVLQLSKALNANIVLGRPDMPAPEGGVYSRSFMLAYTRKHRPYDLCTELYRSGKPTQATLNQWWAQATDPDRMRLYDACQSFSDTTALLVRRIPKLARFVVVPWKEVRVSNTRVLLREDELLDAAGNVLANYRLSVRHIVHVQNNVFSVVGVIQNRERRCWIHFYAKRTSHWKLLHLKKLVGSLTKAGFVATDRDIEKSLSMAFEVSLRVDRPPHLPRMSKTGWYRNFFQFPHHKIGAKFCERTPYRLLRGAPGPRRLPKDRLRSADLSGYSEATQVLFLSLLFGVCSQIHARRHNLKAGGILLQGCPLSLWDTILTAFACAPVPKNGFWEHDWPYVYAGEGSEAKTGNVGLFITTTKDGFSSSHAFIEFPVGRAAGLSSNLAYLLMQSIATYIYQLPAIKSCRTQVGCFDAVLDRLTHWYPEIRSKVLDDWINRESWVVR